MFLNKLNFLVVGDIVWAKRYKNKKEKSKILEGHQESPYIIIKKSFFNIYALQCTSNIKKELKNYYYKLDEKYKLDKQTYAKFINLEKLKYKQFIKKLNTLSKNDLNYLVKKTFCFWKNKKFKYFITIGDIIKYKNKLNYIYNINNQYLCYQICIKKNSKNPIIINDTTYSFDFNSLIKISKHKKINLVDCCDDKQIRNIENKRIEIYNMHNNKDKRGYLIKYSDNFYLIYGVCSTNFLAYKIYLDKDYNKEMKEIIINKGKYYTYFEECKISKSSEFIKYRIASLEELKNIKMLKKIKNFKKKEHQHFKEFKVKSVIENKITNKRYVIIKRINNYIKCVELENFGNILDIKLNNNSPYYFIELLSDYAYHNIKYLLKFNSFKN